MSDILRVLLSFFHLLCEICTGLDGFIRLTDKSTAADFVSTIIVVFQLPQSCGFLGDLLFQALTPSKHRDNKRYVALVKILFCAEMLT